MTAADFAARLSARQCATARRAYFHDPAAYRADAIASAMTLAMAELLPTTASPVAAGREGVRLHQRTRAAISVVRYDPQDFLNGAEAAASGSRGRIVVRDGR